MSCAFQDPGLEAVVDRKTESLPFLKVTSFNYLIAENQKAYSKRTKNLAGFVSLHNDAIGKKDNNFWGDAVTVTRPSATTREFRSGSAAVQTISENSLDRFEQTVFDKDGSLSPTASGPSAPRRSRGR